jgi:nucleotide sugar dehydrogenase
MSSFTIDVIGSGFVGQATGKGFLAKGHRVRFVDVDPQKIEELRRGGFLAYTPQELAEQRENSSISVLTVNTPTREGKIDLTWIRKAVTQLGERMRRQSDYHVVVVRSTVVPGTTEELMTLLEEVSGKQAGKDFGVCMNPEFLRERVAENDFANPWLIVIGELDRRSGDVLAEVYANFGCGVHRLSLRDAEFQKYVHNLFNAVKITFFNEMREAARALGLSAEEVFPLVAKSAEGIWNPEYGTRDFGAFDGHCLPKDTQAFLAWAQRQGQDMPLLATTIAFNNALTLRQQAQAESKRAQGKRAAVKKVAKPIAAVAS